MSAYTTNYSIRYQIGSLQQQIEVAGVTAAEQIQNESIATPNHDNRIAWANWYLKNSPAGWVAFGWPVAMNAAIEQAVEADPTGATVKDSDVQFVVNSAIDEVVADFAANPPKA